MTSRGTPKVTIDIRPLVETHWTGIPVFTSRLIRALKRHGGVQVEYMHRLTRVDQGAVDAAILANTGAFLRDELASIDSAKTEMADRSGCFFYPSVKENSGTGAIEASTIHDLTTLVMPEYHDDRNIAYHLDNLRLQLSSDSTTFCISEATRQALGQAFPSQVEKARIIYQYVDWPERFELLDRNLPSVRLGRYAVVVGTIEPRKNLGLLYRSLLKPQLRSSPLRFVVIGRKGWLVEKFLKEIPDDANNRILYSGFISEFMKYRLIKNAEFLIFPSMYEGFGIPALEAMSLGKPVLASRTSSLPEVVGEAGLFFDPYSVDEFAEALADISKPKMLNALAPLAVEQNARFTWKRMAEPVVDWIVSSQA